MLILMLNSNYTFHLSNPTAIYTCASRYFNRNPTIKLINYPSSPLSRKLFIYQRLFQNVLYNILQNTLKIELVNKKTP